MTRAEGEGAVRYVIPEEVLTAHLQDEAVLLHLGRGLERGYTTDELLAHICEDFEVEAEEAADAIEEQLSRLCELGLVVPK
jgi:hypothetical protein